MDTTPSPETGSPEPGERRGNPLRSLLSDRRRAATVVGVVGGLAVIFGAYSIYGAIRGPYTILQEDQASVAKADLARILQLRTVDTDRDGLSNYDELYRYRTSPYLSDTDSDGTSDRAEVEAGSDPNCPAGAQCTVVTTNTNTQSSNVNATAVNAALSGQLSADELRQVLAGAGAPQYLLDATPDDELVSLYQATLGGTNGNANANVNATGTVNVGANTNAVSATDIGELTAADVRALLIQNGVDEASLAQIDDATLLSIFRQSLNDAQSGNP